MCDKKLSLSNTGKVSSANAQAMCPVSLFKVHYFSATTFPMKSRFVIELPIPFGHVDI